MKIYIDYVFFVNFLFDFILLMGISVLLKRNIKTRKIILGSLAGGLSIFILFLNISSYLFMLLKIISGLLMILITFGYKDIKYTITNLVYLIILSILLGGSLYLINIEIGYEHVGMLFFANSQGLNSILLIFISILIITLYIKIQKKYQQAIKLKYKVDIIQNHKITKLNAYLDTGNNLYDPYFHKPIIILNKGIDIPSKKFIFVPFETLNSKDIMKCIFVDKIYIEKVGIFENVLVGLSNDKFHLSGTDIILHNDLIEGGKKWNY